MVYVKSPPLDELFNAIIDEPFDWDTVVNFRKNPTQTNASHKEKLFAIKVFVESINSYLYLMNTGFVRNKIISGLHHDRIFFK